MSDTELAYKIRKALMERLKNAGISEIDIERSINSLKIIILR